MTVLWETVGNGIGDAVNSDVQDAAVEALDSLRTRMGRLEQDVDELQAQLAATEENAAHEVAKADRMEQERDEWQKEARGQRNHVVRLEQERVAFADELTARDAIQQKLAANLEQMERERDEARAIVDEYVAQGPTDREAREMFIEEHNLAANLQAKLEQMEAVIEAAREYLAVEEPFRSKLPASTNDAYDSLARTLEQYEPKMGEVIELDAGKGERRT